MTSNLRSSQRRPLLRLLLMLPLVLLLPSSLVAVIPPVLYATSGEMDTSYPVWVSHQAAFGSDGKVLVELFYPHMAAWLEETLADPPRIEDGSCIAVDEFYTSYVNPPDRSSFKKLLHESDLIFLATIVSSDFGFDRGVPGQLFEVAPEEVFLGELPLRSYYFYFPVGKFNAGPYKICKNDKRYPTYIPTKGDQVLIAVPRFYKPSPDEPYLDLAYETSIVVIKPDGELSLPATFLRPHPESDLQPFPASRELLLRELRAFRSGEALP